MMEFGWKAKAEHLRMVILSSAHQIARELPSGLARALEIFARGRSIAEALSDLPLDEHKPHWALIEVHGWKIKATMYRRDHQLWWLLRASRKNKRAPSEKDVVFLDKILGHLGAEPDHHEIIGPRTVVVEDGRTPPVGWWTWRNGWLLYEVQVNEAKKRDQDKVRVVPFGTPETDGYVRLPPPGLVEDAGEISP